MTHPAFVVLPIVGILALALVLIASPSKRDLILKRLGLRKKIEPYAAISEKPPVTSTISPDYSNAFPPLCSSLKTLPINARFIPLGTPWSTLRGDELTATGFTVDEARRLIGSMPDYARLSGIPLPQPVWDSWNIEKATARPYRPLRWKYAQTMSIMKLDPSYWLELESTYARRIAQRRDLHAKYPDHVLQCLPGAEMACTELMEHAVQFLCARYPRHFHTTLTSDGHHVLHNAILDTTTNLTTTDPLHVLLQNVPEDFALMQRNPSNGLYYLRAGVICSALGWSLGTKIGKKLADVHAPVPDYKEKMAFSMDRYFSRMPTSTGTQRGSWGLERGEALFAAPNTPPGEALEHERGFQDKDLDTGKVMFRVDWQTLRRLPVSGNVVFNFKALFTPVSEFRYEPGIPRLLGKVLKEGKKEIMGYKGTWAVEHCVLPKLEEWSEEQEREGAVEVGSEVETLKESPWYPGWVQKWATKNGVEGEVFGDGVTGLGRER